VFRELIVNNRSRLIIQNLPKHLTEERLKAHFEKWSGIGHITDVRIQRM
jgi:RNA recognition motif-containing protein